MSILGNAIEVVRNRLTSYRFNSDYRADLLIIERIHGAYHERTSSDDPARYLWRSVCQYRSQSYARSPAVALFAGAAALLAVPLLLLLVRHKVNGTKTFCEYLKIDFHSAYQIPECIRSRTVECRRSARYLSFKDFIFALKLFVSNRAFYPELLFKFLLWISAVRPHLDKFDVKCLVQYCEYSAYSSLRKLFLNSSGVRIANVTHGEEIISCRSAFCSFDEYHAWELTPQFVHDAMRMEYAKRFVFNPCAGLPRAPAVIGTPILGLLWPALDGNNLDVLVDQLNELAVAYGVVVRAHPNLKYANYFTRYRARIDGQCSEARIESVHSFIDRCSIVVGHLSAVLLQAAFRGREVAYLSDPALLSLKEYHDYYRSVRILEVSRLAKALPQMLEQTRRK